jgi:MbtH protein
VEPQGEFFRVVVDAEGRYAIWRLDLPLPDGWKAVGFHGSHARCLAYLADLPAARPEHFEDPA